MIVWVAQFVFYAVLAAAATWASWRQAIALVGVTLGMCLVVSEISYFGATFAARLTLEAIQAVVIINSCRLAFAAGASRATVTIVALAVADLAFVAVVAFGLVNPRAPAVIGDVYGDSVNAIFGLMCLCVAYPGVRDGIMARRADRAAGGLVGGTAAALDARGDGGAS